MIIVPVGVGAGVGCGAVAPGETRPQTPPMTATAATAIAKMCQGRHSRGFRSFGSLVTRRV